MNAFDPQAEDSTTTIGRNLRSRPLARKKLSEMVEEELEQMIRRHDPDEADRALQSHLNSVSATWHAFGQTTNKTK